MPKKRSAVSEKNTPASVMVDAAHAMSSPGLGFETVKVLPGSTYHDNSTVIIVPSRDSMVHVKVVQSWQNLITPMNQKRAFLFATGHEVGRAYDEMIKMVLAHPELSKWAFLMTLETDNIQPPDAHIRLLETIEWGKFDGVSGIYFTKGAYQQPMAYGDPAEYKRTGILDFKPRDIRAALAQGNVMKVNGIAMGCSLYRMNLFREIPPPWFVTVSDVTPEGPQIFTQDLWFCKNAVLQGKTFGVDFRVKVGHLDIETNTVY